MRGTYPSKPTRPDGLIAEIIHVTIALLSLSHVPARKQPQKRMSQEH